MLIVTVTLSFGLISGLLGVGGGGLISPLLIFIGFNPKKVAVITAFVVPFSLFIAFVAYAMMGTVKKFLGVMLFALAVKMILGLVGV